MMTRRNFFLATAAGAAVLSRIDQPVRRDL